MPSLRWLITAGAATLIYLVQAALSLAGGPTLPDPVDHLVRPAIIVGIVLATVAWLQERAQVRLAEHVDRRFDALTDHGRDQLPTVLDSRQLEPQVLELAHRIRRRIVTSSDD
jgi:hypothetical protein